MFKPKGEKPVWQIVYEYVEQLPAETVVTLEELSGAIDGDIEVNRGAVYKARKQLAKNHKRYLVSIRGEGYKVVEGTPMLDHAELRHGIAKRQIDMANYEAVNVDTKKMSLEERQRWSQFMAWNGQAISVLSHNAREIAKANIVSGMANDVISDRLAAMERQLGEMEKLQNELE